MVQYTSFSLINGIQRAFGDPACLVNTLSQSEADTWAITFSLLVHLVTTAVHKHSASFKGLPVEICCNDFMLSQLWYGSITAKKLAKVE
jgi:hypothetical protein